MTASAIIQVVEQVWKIFWGLTAIECVAGIYGIFRVASSGSAAFFGISAARFVLVLLFLLIVAFSGFRIRSGSSRFERSAVGRIGLWVGWLSLTVWAFFKSPYARGVNFEAVFIRILPLLLFASVFAVQALVFSALGFGRTIADWRKARIPLIAAAFVFLLITGLRFFALKTGFGLEPVSGTFYRQGVSILEGPLILPLLIVAPLMILVGELSACARIRTFWDGNRTLLFRGLFFAVWLSAAIVWANVPFEGRSYFLPAQRPPNFNFYPSSDAENYDLLALNLFNGNGFRNGMTVVRPLYIVFLAVLHQFVGTDYLDLTTLQIMVLALIPALIFRLGVRLRSPWTGILAAVWIVAREAYAIRLTPLVQVSNSRLLMSELPMMLIVLWIANLSVDWLRELSARGFARWATVILAAAACGMGALIRTQSIVLVPAVAIVIGAFGLFQKKRPVQASLRTKQLLVFFALTALVILPWTLYDRLVPNPTVRDGTGEGAYLNRLYARAAGVREDGSASSVVNLIRENPTAIGAEIGAHLTNNLLSTVLVLPLRTEEVSDPEQWFFDRGNFWYRESSRPVLERCPILWLLIAAIFAIGLSGGAARGGYAVLVPCALYGAYAVGCAFALNSGFRFILPVDWFALFLFALGFETIFKFLSGAVYRCDSTLRAKIRLPARFDGRTGAVWALGFCLFIAGLLPVMDSAGTRPKILPTQTELFQDWRASRSEYALLDEVMAVGERVDQGGLEFVSGLAVYPRVYLARDGDADGVSSIKRSADFPRLVWMVLTDDQRVLTAALPLTCREVLDGLPDPVRVKILGRAIGDYFAVMTIDSEDQNTPQAFHFESAQLFAELEKRGERE